MELAVIAGSLITFVAILAIQDLCAKRLESEEQDAV